MTNGGFETQSEQEQQPPQDSGEERRRPEPQEAQTTGPDDVAPTVDDLTRRVDELQAQADEWLDKYRRSVAEFSNYRKRQERERQQQSWRLHAEVFSKLLEPLDDFERALKAVPEEHVDSGWIRGVQLIVEKLRALLAEHNVQPMDAVGQPFDPNYHDALMQEPSDEYPEGTVVEEVTKGYLMDGQVLRPAVVKVSSGPQDDR